MSTFYCIAIKHKCAIYLTLLGKIKPRLWTAVYLPITEFISYMYMKYSAEVHLTKDAQAFNNLRVFIIYPCNIHFMIHIASGKKILAQPPFQTAIIYVRFIFSNGKTTSSYACQGTEWMKLGTKYDLLYTPANWNTNRFTELNIYKVLKRSDNSSWKNWFHEVYSINHYLLGAVVGKWLKIWSVCQNIFFQHQTSSCTSSVCV